MGAPVITDAARLRRLRAEGLTRKEIAARFGCSESAVARAVVRFGLVGDLRKVKDTVEFRAAWAGPERNAEIAKRWGVTESAISRAAKEFGYPKRRAAQAQERRKHAEAGAAAEASRLSRSSPAVRASVPLRVPRAVAERARNRLCAAPKAKGAARAAPSAGLVADLSARGIAPAEAARVAAALPGAKTYADLATLAGRLGRSCDWLLPFWHRVRA